MSEKKLFSDFNETSAKAWKQKIQMDLKGADYNNTLLTDTQEGITISPFYHQDSYKSLVIPKLDKPTNICQTIFINDEKKVCNIAVEALDKGADSIRFIASKIFDYTLVFQKLPKNRKQLLFCNFIDISFFKELNTKFKEVKIVVDPILHLSKLGNWYNSQKEDMAFLQVNNDINIGIDGTLNQNAGANIVQQIAYSLCHANEYLNEIEKTKKRKKNNLVFTFAIGSNYFFEISKIRAFTYLFTKLINEYNFKTSFEIVLEPTLRNKTLYDYNVNMLRTTTESMAAMLSDVDYISNVSYDSMYHRSNEFGSRIARNQLLILKEESYFTKENNISKGSYYVEQITFELAEKALILFKDIEKNGGYIKQLQKGTIQRKIKEQANQEQKQFDEGKLILLGTNKYPNLDDLMKEELEIYPFVKTKPRKTIITPIIAKRLAEKMEQERLSQEK